jgi:hypothetical protein
MQYRYGAGGAGSLLAAFAFDAALLLAFGASMTAASATSSCFGGSGSTARNFCFVVLEFKWF